MMRFDPARERALKAAALSPDQIRAGLPAGFFEGAIPAVGQGVGAGVYQTGGLLYGAAGSVVRGYNQVLTWQNDLARWAGLPESGMVSTEWLDNQRDNALSLAQAYKPDPMKTGMAGQIMFELSRVMTQVGLGSAVAVATGGVGATVLATGAATTGAATTYGKFAELKKAGVNDNTALKVAAIEGLVTGGSVMIPAALAFKGAAKLGLAKGTKSYLAANMAYGAGVNIGIGISERAIVHNILQERYPAMAKHYQPLEASALIAEGALGAIFGALGTHAGLRYRAQEVTDAALTALAAKHAALDTAPGIPTDPASANSHAKASDTAMEQLLNGKPVDVWRTGIGEGRFLPRPHAAFDADAAKPIKDNIRAQLDAVDKFDPEVNDTYASFIGNYFAVQGHRLGISPEALFKQYPMNVVGEDAKLTGKKLRQQHDQADLIMTHNLSEAALLHSKKMGGLAAPSFAVNHKNSPLEKFGEITLIGNRDLVEPGKNTKVFGSDIYSPRYPRAERKVDSKAYDAFAKRLDTFARSVDAYVPDQGSLARDGVDGLANNAGMAAWFMRARGIPLKRDGLHRYDLRRQIEEAGLSEDYRNFVRDTLDDMTVGERIFNGYTDAGNRRYIPHTLENVVKILKKNLRGGEGFHYGVGSVRSHYAPQFKSVAQIRKAKDRLVSAEQFVAVKKDIDEEFFRISAKIDPDLRSDTAAAIFEDAATMGVARAAQKYGYTLNEATQTEVAQFLEKLRNLPTEYFEGKLTRAVGVGEFSAAVVSKNIGKEALDYLREQGITDIRFYGDEQSRTEVVQQLEHLFFQNKTNQPVATLTGVEIAPREANIKTLRAAAKQWYDANLRGKKVVNRASGREVEFRNAKKALHSSANPDKLRLFAALEQIVAEGEFKGSQLPDNPTLEKNTKAYHWLEADVSLDGQPVRVGVTLREDNQGNLYYNHNPLAQTKKAPTQESLATPPNKGGRRSGNDAFNQTIPDDALNLQILDQPGARGHFVPSKNTIALLKNADLSTFLHESGHFFLEMHADIAGRADAPLAHKADMQTVLDWFGVRDLNTWHSLSFEQKRAHHEKFARGFEAYLFEGYTPSVELRNLFERVRDWLLKVYRDIKNLNVTLNDQVREVFDRMLATDEQIKRQRPLQIDDAISEQFGTDASREANARINELLTIKDEPPVVLQNRDRSSAASIGQMNAIAGNPDYLRTGLSSTMDQGAPVVFGNADVLPDGVVMGGTQTVADGRGNRYETRYAVVEAQDILTSNTADGFPVATYKNGQVGKVRTVAGNGRAAGLLAAYQRGTAETYRAELRADLEKIGIDPQAIDAMRQPVLVRVMEEGDVRPDIGDASNISASAALSPVEQAANDVRRVDIADFSFDDNGNPTRESIKAFVAAMPEAERAALSNPDGSPTRQALDRIMAATFHQAYGNDELVRLFAQATEKDAVNTINALAKAASRMARLADTGEYDLRDIVAQAGVMAVNASRKGVKLGDFVRQADLSTDPQTIVVAEFIARNHRSSSKMAEGLRNLSDKAWEQVETLQTNMEQVGLFGEQPVLSREQVLQTLLKPDHGVEARSTQAPSEPAPNRDVQYSERGDHREVSGEHTAESSERSNAEEGARVDDVENPPDVIAPPEPLRITPKIKAELAQRFVTAGQVKPRFDATLKRIAEDTGATLKTAPLKGVERAVAKILNDYAGDVSRIKDLVRATMIVNDTYQAAQVIQRVERFLGGKVKRDNLSSDHNVPPTGYRDAFIMVEIDGFPAELQINVPEMMVAKEKAHPLYVKKSTLERKIESEGREPTASEQAGLNALDAQQRNIYIPAWEATKARNSSSVRSAPLRENESDGNLRPPGTSQAMATQLGVRDTGISSTSANKVPSGNDSGNPNLDITESLNANLARARADLDTRLGITDPPDAILPLTAARAGDDLETRAGLALLEERGDQLVPVELDDGQIVHLSPQEMLREADAELAHTNKATLDAAVQCALTHGM